MRGGEGEEDNGDIYEVSQPQSLTGEAPCKVAVGAKLSGGVSTQQREENDKLYAHEDDAIKEDIL